MDDGSFNKSNGTLTICKDYFSKEDVLRGGALNSYIKDKV